MSLFSGLGRSLGLSSGRSLGLSSGGMTNPADNAMGYLNQIPGMARQYLEPYIGEGRTADTNARNAYNQVSDIYNPQSEVSQGYRQMSSNPLEYVNQIMRGYQPSEGYKYKENRALQAMKNSANAGGFAGNPYDQEEQARTVNGLLGEDMQQFLQNILGAQSQGLGGLERQNAGRASGFTNLGGFESGIGNRGFNAASDLTNILGSNLGQQAGAAFQGQRQVNANRQQARSNRLGLFKDVLGMFGGNFMGGGGVGGGWNNPNNGGGNSYGWGNPNY